MDDGYSTPYRPQYQNEGETGGGIRLALLQGSSLTKYASIIARLRERQASLLRKAFWRGKRLGRHRAAQYYSELRTREKIQEKNELPFLSLELQVTIIKASICKILVA